MAREDQYLDEVEEAPADNLVTGLVLVTALVLFVAFILVELALKDYGRGIL
ncbi:MAG: hypothetical protein ACYTDY_02465 [Planctomycetota bacterium]|jgi:hypothetical protein